MRFSDAKLNALKEDTSSDPELSALREIIYSGWPEKRKQVPVPLRKYWAYPHQGVEKCQWRARSCIFCPNIDKDIEARVQKCKVCQEGQNTQAKETLEPHEGSTCTRPWQIIGTDLFTWNGDEYLLM